MNIWIVNHYAIPPQQVGGTRHYALAKELIRRGHRVTIVASSFDHATRREEHLAPGELFKLEVVEDVPFLWLRTPPYAGNSVARVWNMAVFAYRVWRIAGEALVGRPDVVIGSSPHLFAALAAERLAARFRAPFVLEVRDLWPQTLIDLGSFSARHPFILLLEKIERYLYRKATRIITLLPGAGEHIKDKGGDPSRVVWIPNGIDLELVPPPQPPDEDEVFTLMYAGAHGLANGLHTVLEVAHHLEQEGWGEKVRFRLVGDGPEKPSLMERASGLRLTSVVFEDPVPKREVYRLLQQADAFLMILMESSLFRWGVSPNKLFDFMASARPIVFSVSTRFNPVEEAKAGFTVPAGDPIALAKAIKRLAAMPREERWAMGLRGRRYVEEHHAFNRLVDKLEEVLQDVAQARALIRA